MFCVYVVTLLNRTG